VIVIASWSLAPAAAIPNIHESYLDWIDFCVEFALAFLLVPFQCLRPGIISIPYSAMARSPPVVPSPIFMDNLMYNPSFLAAVGFCLIIAYNRIRSK
jgi:hypothetical protein